MAVVFIEGFDHMTAAQTLSKGWSNAPQSMVAGRLSGQAASINGVGAIAATKLLPATYSTLFFGFAFNCGIPTTAHDFMILKAGATATFRIGCSTSGTITVKNSGGTTIATGTTVLAVNTWYYIELGAFVNVGTPASGTCEIHLNGITEIASTVGNFGSALLDRINYTTGGVSGTNNFDDIYVADTTGGSPGNTFLGDTRVQTLFPNADGTYTQLTPHPSGSHFANIDETTPDDDTTYNGDSTPGDIDTYLTAGIPASASVPGVQVNLYARKDDAGVRQIAPLIRQAATDYPGSTVALSVSYLFYSQLYALDPSGASWTANNVSANEYGVKVIA